MLVVLYKQNLIIIMWYLQIQYIVVIISHLSITKYLYNYQELKFASVLIATGIINIYINIIDITKYIKTSTVNPKMKITHSGSN